MKAVTQPLWQEVREADLAVRAGECGQAIARLEPIVEEYPEYATARKILASAYRDSARPEEAVIQLQVVLEQRPADQAALKTLGDLLLHRGEILGARVLFERLRELRPTDGFVREILDEMTPDPALSLNLEEIAALPQAMSTDATSVIESGQAAMEEIRGETPVPALLEADVESLPIPSEATPAEVAAALVQEAETVDLDELVIEETEPPARPTRRGKVPGQLETVTIADIYAAQGLTVPALEIYRKHLAARPDDEEIAEKIRILESQVQGGADPEGD